MTSVSNDWSGLMGASMQGSAQRYCVSAEKQSFSSFLIEGSRVDRGAAGKGSIARIDVCVKGLLPSVHKIDSLLAVLHTQNKGIKEEWWVLNVELGEIMGEERVENDLQVGGDEEAYIQEKKNKNNKTRQTIYSISPS